MKKAGIITHYDGPNYGAQLQLYGLVRSLKKIGYEAKALRYMKNYDFMGAREAEKKYRISIHSIPVYLKYLFKNGVSRTLYNIRKRRTIAKFQQKHNLLGSFYSDAYDLDALVIGSDEIFSIEAGPNPWYYGNGIPCDFQISYAASFGPTTLQMIKDHHMEGLIQGSLRQMKHISVRDKNSSAIVEHYTGVKPSIVCDPVLLDGFLDELTKGKIDAFRKKHVERYCIVYSYDSNMNDEETIKAIRRYASEKGLKVYSVAYFHRWCDKTFDIDLLDVFKWFACSEMVFTDTFHGSVISLVSGAQFVAKIRGNGNKLMFLLEQYGVSDRVVNSFAEIEHISSRMIDYSIVNFNIKRIRSESMEYLQKALGYND